MNDLYSYCLKLRCPNTTQHKSCYCSECRTFICPKCKKKHTVMEAPHNPTLRLCAHCRKSKKNIERLRDGEFNKEEE